MNTYALTDLSHTDFERLRLSCIQHFTQTRLRLADYKRTPDGRLFDEVAIEYQRRKARGDYR